MRILDTDNFEGDYPTEKFLLWPMSKESAQAICDVLNEDSGELGRRYYRVVQNDYKLNEGFVP